MLLETFLRDAHRETAALLQRLESRGGDAQPKVHTREAERGASWMELLDVRERRGRFGKGMSCSTDPRVSRAL